MPFSDVWKKWCRDLRKTIAIVSVTVILAMLALSQREGISRMLSWRSVYSGAEWYRENYEGEMILKGRLEKGAEELHIWVYPNGTWAEAEEGESQPLYTSGVSWYWGYFLEGRPIRTHGTPGALDEHVGRDVEIKGKLVQLEEHGVEITGVFEIWPGKIRKQVA
jgi:hypothetical protein